MPIALLQFCLAAAASRALVADHNRHLINRTPALDHRRCRRSLTPATAAAASSSPARRRINSLVAISFAESNSSSVIGGRSLGSPISRCLWTRSGTVTAVAVIAAATAARHLHQKPDGGISVLAPHLSPSFLNRLRAATLVKDMASSGVRRRSSAKNSVDGAKITSNDGFTSSRSSSITKLDQIISSGPEPSPSTQLADLMTSPVSTQTPGTRQSRASTASSTASGTRISNPNRLSLTLPLPIALPSPDPSRPSVPPTPASSSLASSNCTSTTSLTSADADPNDFIIAIAAQERRVLELREELARAEADLTSLKSQWTQYEGTRKRNVARVTRAGGMHSMPSTPRGDTHPASQDDGIAARRSVELDRRRTMLLNQQSAPGSPRRRVIRGGHARTLSLLSPTKTDGTYSIHEDEPLSATLNLERRSTDIGSAYRSAAIQKRASWQPRIHPSNSVIPPPAGMGMAAIVEDLKLGFRTLATFVDDIRQVTVGDEPITGQIRRHGDEEWAVGGGLSRSATPSKDGDEQRTIRPAGAARPTLDTAFEPPTSGTQTPSKASKQSLLDEVDPVSDRSSSKAAARKKHFSWAPLEFSNLDEEWAAWDSPLSTKSTRWSDSNESGSSSDDSASKNGDSDTPLKKKSTSQSTTSTLDDLLPQMVNRFSPGNLKRATSDFMGQWERSLTTPSSPVTPIAEADDQDNLISF